MKVEGTAGEGVWEGTATGDGPSWTILPWGCPPVGAHAVKWGGTRALHQALLFE